MTSDCAARANRQNAAASTGPRTVKGKARSSQNARKHGLSVANRSPQMEEQTVRLTDALLVGTSEDSARRQAARAVAEAQLDLIRVLAYKHALIRDWAPDLIGKLPVRPAPNAHSRQFFAALKGLERYERRAFSRRKAALRWFITMSNHVGPAARATITAPSR